MSRAREQARDMVSPARRGAWCRRRERGVSLVEMVSIRGVTCHVGEGTAGSTYKAASLSGGMGLLMISGP